MAEIDPLKDQRLIDDVQAALATCLGARGKRVRLDYVATCPVCATGYLTRGDQRMVVALHCHVCQGDADRAALATSAVNAMIRDLTVRAAAATKAGESTDALRAEVFALECAMRHGSYPNRHLYSLRKDLEHGRDINVFL